MKAVSGGGKSLLAPELMEAYRSKDPKPVFNLYKADVYSLGMTLLSAMALEDPTEYYDWSKGINHDKVEEDLRDSLKLYSKYLVDFIRRMLLVNPLQRLTFIEFYRLLIPYQ